MKRYIRTKNGKIFDTDFKSNWSLEPRFMVVDNRLIIYDLLDNSHIANHGLVVGEADRIEDLCDDFFCVAKKHNPKLKHNRWYSDDLDYILKDLEWVLDNYNVYGGILTETGFEFVAKMNYKGEFELL